MEIVDNVIKINSNNRDFTSVKIEEADESWALQLLNECEAEDDQIIVQGEELLAVKNVTDVDSLNVPKFTLTAIENQKLALAEKQQAQALEEQANKLKSNFNFSRIKTFFTA